MECPLQILQRQQLGKRMSVSCLDLACRFTQLRRNVVQVQGGKEVGLLPARLLPLHSFQGVLIELVAIFLGACPDGNVVLLAAGEVV